MTKANITWTAKQITKMYNAKTFNFNNIIQRSYVWETKRKSDLIHSMMEGYPIPPFYARRVDGKVYDFLDGKQRMNAIAGFINGEYALEGLPDFTYTDDDGNEIIDSYNGMTFDLLPEDVQDAIKDYTLTIYYYDDITDFQIREMFRKLNNGKPLSTKEKNIASCIDIVNLEDLGKHEVFNLILTEKGKDQRKYIPIIMKSWMMLNSEISELSFDSKTFNQIMAETETTEEERAEIKAVFDKYVSAWRLVAEMDNVSERKATLKKIEREIHFISLIPFVQKAIDEDVSDQNLADWFANAFNKEITVSDKYTEACVSGSARVAAVNQRNEELEKSWSDFFKADENAEEEDVTQDAVEYKYGMRLRGFAPLCQPKYGFLRREDSSDDRYWDIIVYNRELDEDEMKHYDLDRVA